MNLYAVTDMQVLTGRVVFIAATTRDEAIAAGSAAMALPAARLSALLQARGTTMPAGIVQDWTKVAALGIGLPNQEDGSGSV